MNEAVLDLSTVTTNGQVTIPAPVRRLLGIKPGNKVMFFQRENGDVVIENATVAAVRKAQIEFAGASADLGYADEEDVLEDVMRTRYESKKQ